MFSKCIHIFEKQPGVNNILDRNCNKYFAFAQSLIVNTQNMIDEKYTRSIEDCFTANFL